MIPQVRIHKSSLSLVVRLMDSLATVVGMWLALRLIGGSFQLEYLVEVLFAILIFQFFTIFSHSYTRHSPGISNSALVVVLTWVITMPISAGLTQLVIQFFENFRVEDRVIELRWYPITALMMLGWRFALLGIGRLFGSGKSRRVIGVVGSGELALRIVERIRASSFFPVDIIGCFDDRALEVPIRASSTGEQGSHQRRVAVIEYKGTIADLVEMTEKGLVNDIFIALPMRAESLIKSTVRRLQNSAASVYLCPDLALFDMINASAVDVGDMLAINVFDNPFAGASGWIKRLEDIVVGTVTLLICSVPMIITAIAIKVTSPGPIFFRQTRYGEDGRAIGVFKFRSMRVLENSDVVRQATRDDDRVTSVGRFIRRYSIDELPQLFNVIIGDMSIVGPRPHAVAHNEHYRGLISGYMLRHKVKPGITGWAQVNGLRGETETVDKMARRVEFDLEYIRNWSVLFDLEIMFLTVMALVTDSDVY